jgi:molybdopterin-containing oxidoreductase family iron-sulfur binding subunit
MKPLPIYNFSQIRERLAGSQGKAFWRGLDELANTEEFQEFLQAEFPQQAAPLESSLNRRDFIKLLGASLALAGLAGCARPATPADKIVAFVRAPEEVIPGQPLFFATALTQGGYALGALVESHMGRPTKVEGNSLHPASLGASDALMQAEVLTMYDPDRSSSVLAGGAPGNYDALLATLQGALGERGQGFSILTETVTSPSLARLISELLTRYPEARWHQYEPTHRDNALAGAELAFGRPVETRYQFDNAEVILSLDADFLGSGPGKLAYSKAFGKARRVRTATDTMNRLYVVEATPTITGSVADHRLPLRPDRVAGLAQAVAHAVGVGVEAAEPGVPQGWFETLIDDLRAYAGRGLVIAGDTQPAEVHALAHAINEALGNVGSTMVYSEVAEARPVNHLADLSALVEAMNAGEVSALLMLGGNPVYNAPADLDFAAALGRVPLSVHHSLYVDETSALAGWHLPLTHELETWGDARAFDGTTGIQQPLIAPFYNGISPLELLSALLGTPQSAYEVVRDTWQVQVVADFEAFWRQAVHDGVIAGSQAPVLTLSVNQAALSAPLSAASSGPLLILRPDPSVGDGRYANNGWLQELPKPFTKLTWDNAALLSPSLAERLGINNHDLLSLSLAGRTVEAAAWIMPGQAEDTVTLHLGYGRERAGRVGSGLGFNAYALRTSTAPWGGPGLEITKTGQRYRLASAQHHQVMDATARNRHIIRTGTLAEFKAEPEHPQFVHPIFHPESNLHPPFVFEHPTYAWGMVIDQTVCTGCNACVVACQAENNIPIVGKQQVMVGREMHWMRVDGYYGGDLDNPEFYQQPVLCMHCDQAPCEPVCPVTATLQNNEGLNVMVYSRCVGTRACSNNCPYKVRRFNWLQYAELTPSALALQKNPDVTVRSRGIMEKCTFCIQRISEARINAGNQSRTIRDGEVITACQAACPTEAIVFGDTNDPASQVSLTKASALNYHFFEELNTFPRTTYLARLKNPHSRLAESEGD